MQEEKGPKPRRKRSRHQETSLDSEYEEGSDDAFKELNSPYKRPKPTPFTQIITHFKYHKRTKLPRNIRTKCSKGPDPSLGEKWSLDRHKWSVLLKETRDTFVRHGSEDLKEKETGAAQGKHEGIWGCTLLILEKTLSPAYQDSERNPRHGKLEEANRGSRGLRKIGSSSEGHLPKQPAEWEPGKERCEGEGLIRKVLPPKWITNAIPIKLTNETWKVQMDYSGLNKACAKDMYPLLEEGEELASLMGYPYKCFLQLPKEYNQIRMAEGDAENTGFHTEEGVYCFTHMPKELKNFTATLQRMMEKVLTDQRGWNVEIYLEVIVIKSKSELDLVLDVKETLRKLKRVNIKIDLAMSSFRVKEGKEAIEEDSGIEIILVSPEEKMYSYAIRLKFKASNYAIDCEALLAGLAASDNQGMKDLHVFIDSLTLVAQVEGNHTPAAE
ncbi:reverse transcriptase domain-containing protein [Tanacetum coccineum]